MKQVILKGSYNLGWGSSEFRVSLDGEGGTHIFDYHANRAKIVIPLDGTFRNLNVYSPAGLHPNYTVTMMVNGVASALTCALADIQTQAKDVTHSVNVVTGDDIYFRVIVNPIGSGIGYPMSLSVEFEGAQQFYAIAPAQGGHSVNTYHVGGALGNGIFESLSNPTFLLNTYSICTTPGNLTGIRMKTFAGNVGTGVWTGYIVKNQVLQDGTGGTVNTACILTGANTQASNTFSLPIVVGDHLNFALRRTVNTSPFALAEVTVAVTFTPTDSNTFMCCGGNNNANDETNVDWRWMQSQQLQLNEAKVQCPIGPRGIVVTGLRVEHDPPGLGKNVIHVLRKNGVNTIATVTIADIATSATISGLSIPFVDGDLIALQTTPVGTPTLGNGMWWGLSVQASVSEPPVPPSTTSNSGLYFINPVKATKRDTYFDDGTGVGTVEKKIPDPIIRTALIGE